MPLHLLANIVWHTLAGPQNHFAAGTATARRYAMGFSPIVAFVDVVHPDFDALTPYCASGEHFYCGGWAGATPAGWSLEVDSSALQMIWDRDLPMADPAFNPVQLDATHVPQMLALVAIAPPGPFAARTIELGEYYGVFEGTRLVAMAGERMQAGKLREISGVCTHPEFQRRGLARRLVAHLIRIELARGQTPFLHVMQDNPNARRIYENAGFRPYQEIPVRVLARA
ncbi:MAG: GNAT family N-acetyltransferase [Betaproteobacteria bacterium]